MLTLCFASRNKGKIAEIQALLGNNIQVLSLDDINCQEELPETTETIAGNSAQKATYVFQKYHLNCFADDSGLVVEVLQGEPGVHSAYYAGLPKNDKKNIDFLLQKLANHTNRKAYFITVITLIIAGKTYQFEGKIAGVITQNPKGEGGFGYDPIFQPEGEEQTFAQLGKEAKNKISHRGQAIEKMRQFLLTFT